MSNILIGVTGGIAAYKTASVVSILVDKGHDVRVIMTEAATKFVAPLTFSALSHNPVYLDDFTNDGHIWHIELAEWANVFAIVPATYNTIRKVCWHQFADNLLTSTVVPYLGSGKKLLVFPAMNTHMLKMCEYIGNGASPGMPLHGNIQIEDTAEGKMACGTVGKGKLLPTREIVERIVEAIPENTGL